MLNNTCITGDPLAIALSKVHATTEQIKWLLHNPGYAIDRIIQRGDGDLDQVLFDAMYWLNCNTVPHPAGFCCLMCMRLCTQTFGRKYRDARGARICNHCKCNNVVNNSISDTLLQYLHYELFSQVYTAVDGNEKEVSQYELYGLGNVIYFRIMAKIKPEATSEATPEASSKYNYIFRMEKSLTPFK
jgi:hypothetical protein